MGAPVLAGMGIGAALALAQGRDPLKAAAIGGVSGGFFGGADGLGSGFGLDGMGFDLGSGALANTGTNSLNAGAGLMGGTGTAVGTGATTGATTGILGSSTNAINNYDIGMEGVKTNIGGFTAPVEQSLVNANAYQPLNGGIAPDMSFKQSYINTTPEQGLANLGTPQRPNLNEYPTIMGGEGSSVGIDTTSRDVSGNYEALATSPDFNNITKSSPEEIANAQGGYDKPLYEKAFDSVMGFAQENPIALATLGMTALGGGSSASPQQVTQSAGKIAQQAYNPNKERILNIRRA